MINNFILSSYVISLFFAAKRKNNILTSFERLLYLLFTFDFNIMSRHKRTVPLCFFCLFYYVCDT